MKKILPLYLETLKYRTRATRITYTQGIRTFQRAVGENAPIDLASYITFLQSLAPYPTGTQHVYRAAVIDLYTWYCDTYNESVNFLAMKRADKRYLKRESSLLTFERDPIVFLNSYAESLKCKSLADLRDKAFIFLLMDSGLRISEACNLTRGDIDWNTKSTYIIGKGNKKAKVRFSDRFLTAAKRYLAARAKLDGETGRPLNSLPLFARHDRGSGKKVKPVAPGGMWTAFVNHLKAAGIEKGSTTPHKLRHEAITRFYEETGDIKLTMMFSRHSRIDTVNRYTHLIDTQVDQSFDEIFNKDRDQ